MFPADTEWISVWNVFGLLAFALLIASEVCRGCCSRATRVVLYHLRWWIIVAAVALVETAASVKLFTLKAEDLDAAAAARQRAAIPRLPSLRKSIQAARQAHSASSAEGRVVPEGRAEAERACSDEAFLEATTLFSCLDLQQSRQLFSSASKVVLLPGQVLFRAGDPSESGIFIVREGRLGLFTGGADEAGSGGRSSSEQGRPISTLAFGESVGDLDVLDGAPRSSTCVALGEGCMLVQVPRSLFLSFVRECPSALHIFLQRALGRLWRESNFVLSDFLGIPIHSLPPPVPGYLPRISTADHAALRNGWYVVAPEESGIKGATWSRLLESCGMVQGGAAAGSFGRRVELACGEELYQLGQTCAQFYVLLEGSLTVERLDEGGGPRQRARVVAGSLLCCTAFLSGAKTSARCWAGQGEGAVLAAFGPADLASILAYAAGGTGGAADASGAPSLGSPAKGPGPLCHSPNGTGAAPEPSGKEPASPFLSRSLGLSFSHSGTLSDAELLLTRSLSTALSSPMGSLSPAPSPSPGGWEQKALPRAAAAAGEGVPRVGCPPAELAEVAEAFVDLMLAAGRSMAPMIRHVAHLGFRRMWLRGGEVVYRQGEPAESLYVVINGQCKLLHYDPSAETLREEDTVGRGDAMGAVWAISGGTHDTSCVCTRDTDLVGMTREAFERLVSQHPKAAAKLLQGMAARLASAKVARRHHGVPCPLPAPGAESKRRGDVVTIALVPAGRWREGGEHGPASNITQLGLALQECLESMWGPTLLLTSETMAAAFPATFSRLRHRFYRRKLGAWMAEQEEGNRFILLQADTQPTPWSHICTAHADYTLLVADPHSSRPEVSELEQALVWGAQKDLATLLHPDTEALLSAWEEQQSWGAMQDIESLAAAPAGLWQPGGAGAHTLGRVELVLVHGAGQAPEGTADWLAARPGLTRHHHIRPTQPGDLARLSRWAAGRAVGVVLTGGGCRGLAHLGVLRALEEAGMPVDVVGGISQGAFTAALYAQDQRPSAMHTIMRQYVSRLHTWYKVLLNLTYPIVSVFHGSFIIDVLREALSQGPQQIEDLYLKFFCVSTNVTKGVPAVHEVGPLPKMVRASMTLLGFLPPVFHEGDLLADGGFVHNIPVDVMRSMGVDKVIVVDVEDRDQSEWERLTPYEGGFSGWVLIWDRICPIPAWRFNHKIPRYGEMVHALTTMGHLQNLRRVSEDFSIDLYLRPPVIHYRMLDFHFMDRIVEESTQYTQEILARWRHSTGGWAGCGAGSSSAQVEKSC